VRVTPYCFLLSFAAAQPKNGSATEPVALTIDGPPALQDELSENAKQHDCRFLV
jgi:hypothetical protein